MFYRIYIMLLPAIFALFFSPIKTTVSSTKVLIDRTDTVREPKMNLEETITQDMIVLTIRDTAKTMNDIAPRIGADYTEIGGFLGKSGLAMVNAPMAWYLTQGEPFIFLAAIAVDKEPTEKPTGRIEWAKISGGKAIVVHFWGPYDLSLKTYPLIADWLKKNNKQADGFPYDVYVTDPNGKDPYEVQTDIYQKIK